MELGYYKLISAVPTLVSLFWFIGYLILSWKGERVHRFIAIFAFSKILKKKTNHSGATKGWLFKKVFLGNGEEKKDLRETVFYGLFAVFNTLFLSVFFMFYHLLLLDVSYTCDQDDKTKECFNIESENRGLEIYSIEPINCSSAAVQNGSVDVVCYKFVFNVGLAIGASYGTFKFAMVLVNLAAAAMLMIKQAEKIKKIRIAVFILALGVIGAFSAVRSTRLRAFFVSDHLTFIVQNTCSGGYWMYFRNFCPLEGAHRTKKCTMRRSSHWSRQPPDCYGRSLTYPTSVKRISGTSRSTNLYPPLLGQQQTKHKFLGNLQTF